MLAASVFFSSSAAGQSLDVESWLRRPGVKLVVVEFYATWCKPCMDAVPRWRALHDRFRPDGLRFVVVATRDAQGLCANPGWTPDEVICDDDGLLADRFGANPLPSAYLWGWQGHLLASRAHVDVVEQQVVAWMKSAPRVDVQALNVPSKLKITRRELRDAVRSDLLRSDKLVVVANAEERARLRALVKRSLDASSDESLACEVGKEMSANSLLQASISQGERPRLRLQLLSAERGCLVAGASTRWIPDKPAVSVSEAVAALLSKLRLPRTQLPVAPAVQGTAPGALGVRPFGENPEQKAPAASSTPKKGGKAPASAQAPAPWFAEAPPPAPAVPGVEGAAPGPQKGPKVAPIVVTSLGVAGLITGTVLLIVANDRASFARTGQVGSQAAIATAESTQTGGLVTLGASAVVLGLGLWSFAW